MIFFISDLSLDIPLKPHHSKKAASKNTSPSKVCHLTGIFLLLYDFKMRADFVLS